MCVRFQQQQQHVDSRTKSQPKTKKPSTEIRAKVGAFTKIFFMCLAHPQTARWSDAQLCRRAGGHGGIQAVSHVSHTLSAATWQICGKSEVQRRRCAVCNTFERFCMIHGMALLRLLCPAVIGFVDNSATILRSFRLTY